MKCENRYSPPQLRFLLLLIPHILLAFWDKVPIQNINTSQHIMLNTTIEAEKDKRNRVSENFKEKLHLNNSEAKKATYRLQKLIVDDKKRLYLVDIFISDRVPVVDIESIQVPNYSFSVAINDKKVSSTFKHNGRNISSKEAQEIIELDNSRQKELRERYRYSRQQNLETVIKTLQDDISTTLHDKLLKSLEKGVSYISLALDSQTIAKLLKNTNGAISDMDIHINFATSGAEQEPHSGDSVDIAAWRARFNSYLDETHANQRQTENYNAWSGTDIGIYYSDVECPSEDDVFNEVATFTGYTPPSVDNYDIFYLDGDPVNNGNIIDENTSIKNAYNYRTHTKIITGILSTVAPEANLFCKSAEFSSFEADDYSDENITVYEDIIPTETEMQSVDIESYSLNRYASADFPDSTRDYYPMDRVFDNHAYDYNVPIFISAANLKNANPDNDVISPAKAFNIITVGNYGYNGDNLMVLNTSSSFNNPLLEGNLSKSYQKPEISAPGTDFYQLYYTINDDIVDYFNSSGTSFSTPFTAALTADVMSHFHSLDPSYDFFVQGALYKAIMIGLARDFVHVENTQGFNNRYFTGEGGADIWAMRTKSAIYNANNQSTIFSENINGKMCFTGWKADLSGTSHVRFVVAWFNRLADANVAHIPNNYTLEVLNPQGSPISFINNEGEYATVANEPNQGYQMIKFTLIDVPQGEYKARVCQTDIHDNNKAKFGFSASQVFFTYTPPTPPPAGVMEVIRSYILD